MMGHPELIESVKPVRKYPKRIMSLVEVSPKFLKQDAPGMNKRWFADEDIDLTVWEDPQGRLLHLQLVLYGRDIIDWERGRGLKAGEIDKSGSSGGKAAATWVYQAEPREETLALAAEQFRQESQHMEHIIRHTMLQALAGSQPDASESFEAHPEAVSPAPVTAVLEEAQGQLESRVITIALKTPGQIKQSLLDCSAEGWDLRAAGSNHCLMQRDPREGREDCSYDIRSITLYLPHQIQNLLNANGVEGRALRGVGPSFAFLKRVRNRPLAPREYELESVTILTIAQIAEMLRRRAKEGWGLCGMGRTFAFFERYPADAPRTWEHKFADCNLLSISTATANVIREIMDREAREGWQPCALGSRYVFFRRPSPIAASGEQGLAA